MPAAAGGSVPVRYSPAVPVGAVGGGTSHLFQQLVIKLRRDLHPVATLVLSASARATIAMRVRL